MALHQARSAIAIAFAVSAFPALAMGQADPFAVTGAVEAAGSGGIGGLRISASAAWYQHPAGSDGPPNPALIAAFPDLQYDSYFALDGDPNGQAAPSSSDYLANGFDGCAGLSFFTGQVAQIGACFAEVGKGGVQSVLRPVEDVDREAVFLGRYTVQGEGGTISAQSILIGVTEDGVQETVDVGIGKAFQHSSGNQYTLVVESFVVLAGQGVVRVNDLFLVAEEGANKPEPGACCFGAGECELLFEQDCFAFGGQYFGDGTACPGIEIFGLPVAPEDLVEPAVRDRDRRTPIEWQDKIQGWAYDMDGNFVDDEIDAALVTNAGDPLSVLLLLNDCPTEEDLERFAQAGTVRYVAKYIPVVILTDVMPADAVALGQDLAVAGVELDREGEYTLDTSTAAIRYRASGTYSPNTVEDAYPAIDGSGTNIAILDSGVDDGHQSFSGALVAEYDALTDTENPGGGVDDVTGHGTHVAGIALGRGNGVSNRGVAPGAGLVDMLVGNFAPSTAAVVLALEKCIERRVDWNIGVVNLSLGLGPASDGLDATSQLASRVVDAGIVVVVASGNSGIADIDAPGAADKVITVGAINDNGTVSRVGDAIAGFSTIGPRLDDGDSNAEDEQKPEVTAPGVGITSAQYNTASGYIPLNGTSMASPHVAGLAALIKSAAPSINADSVTKLIIDTSEDYGPAGFDVQYGYGYVDAFAAIDGISTALTTDVGFTVACCSSPDIVPSDPTIEENEPNSFTVTVTNFGPNDAFDVQVNLGIYIFSNGGENWEICSDVIPFIASGATASVTCPWTPFASGPPPGYVHGCLKANIAYAFDSNFANNKAQRNIDIEQTASPAKFDFQVMNDTDEELLIVLAHDLEVCEGQGLWGAGFDLNNFVMQPGQCPVGVRAELVPRFPQEMPPGSFAQANVKVVGYSLQKGIPYDLGGVQIVAQTPEFQDCNENGANDLAELATGAAFDCNENGLLDSCDIAQGKSADVNQNGIPDECEDKVVPVCPGDLDGDGDTDSDDLGILLGAFGTTGAGDLNNDGQTDSDDLGILLSDFGC
ncbi:MAG: S8 family peptidase [Phycisphaerales bacterium]